jgi:hypothetical protein
LGPADAATMSVAAARGGRAPRRRRRTGGSRNKQEEAIESGRTARLFASEENYKLQSSGRQSLARVAVPGGSPRVGEWASGRQGCGGCGSAGHRQAGAAVARGRGRGISKAEALPGGQRPLTPQQPGRQNRLTVQGLSRGSQKSISQRPGACCVRFASASAAWVVNRGESIEARRVGGILTKQRNSETAKQQKQRPSAASLAVVVQRRLQAHGAPNPPLWIRAGVAAWGCFFPGRWSSPSGSLRLHRQNGKTSPRRPHANKTDHLILLTTGSQGTDKASQ